MGTYNQISSSQEQASLYQIQSGSQSWSFLYKKEWVITQSYSQKSEKNNMTVKRLTSKINIYSKKSKTPWIEKWSTPTQDAHWLSLYKADIITPKCIKYPKLKMNDTDRSCPNIFFIFV